MSEGARTRRLTALVLESLRGRDLEDLCAGEPVTPEELAALRAAFIQAGTARIHQIANPVTWVQAHATLDPPGEQWLRLIARPLRGIVQSWLDEGLITAFHFVHKPPGMRLRFLGARERLIPEVDALFGAMTREGALKAYARGVYDAEVYQFGGEAGLAAAHDFFTAESLAVLGFHELQIGQASRMGAPEFSLVLLDLFLRRITDDEWELWDLWCKMELTGRSLALTGEQRERAAASARAAGEAIARVLRDPGAGLERLPDAERSLLLAYREALPPIVSRVRALQHEGELLFPLREILPFWIIFHFNRMGFSGEDQSFLAFLMTCILSPKRTHAGAQDDP